MSGRQLENGALNDTIFTDSFFGLGGEGLKRRGEVLGGGGFVFRGMCVSLGLFAGRLFRLLLLGSDGLGLGHNG